MKQKILRAIFFGARDKKTAHALATEITPNDLESALTNRQKTNADYKNHQAYSHADKFLQTIDAVARAIPHTNEAARKACAEPYAHQHTFGLPHIFLTVTLDDENSFLVEVSSG